MNVPLRLICQLPVNRPLLHLDIFLAFRLPVKLEGKKAATQAAMANRIRQIFQAELKLKSITIEDNFFDLGGDSLMAENIVLALQREFSIELKTAVLLSAPSPSELAELIERQKTSAFEPSVLITEMSSPTATLSAIMVHGMSGSPLFVSRLGQKFKSIANIYAVRGYGSSDGEKAFSDPDDIIETYADAVKTVAGKPPEVFGGICLGAFIAFDMARRNFERTGRRPRCILIDPPSIDEHWLLPLENEQDAEKRRMNSEQGIKKYRRILHFLTLLRLDRTRIGRRTRLLLFKKSLRYAFLGFPMPVFPCDVLILASSQGHQTVAQYTDNLPDGSFVKSVVVEGEHKGFQSANRELIDSEIEKFLGRSHEYRRE